MKTMLHLNQIRAFFLTFAIVMAGMMSLSGAAAMAQEMPNYYTGPWPDASGEYPLKQDFQESWIVVSQDPNGLMCRSTLPNPEGNVTTVKTFSKGTILVAVPRERGVEELVTVGGKTWLRVLLENNASCWVPANKDVIQPLE